MIGWRMIKTRTKVVVVVEENEIIKLAKVVTEEEWLEALVLLRMEVVVVSQSLPR
jgi:hypothetical protein